ncbi:MAG: hypothetical protein ACI9VT_003325, partial [Psychroserpens sp.]
TWFIALDNSMDIIKKYIFKPKPKDIVKE